MNHLHPAGLPKPLLDFPRGAALWSPAFGLCFKSYSASDGLVVIKVDTEERIACAAWEMFQEVEA